jgi:hypothetical protein
LDRRIGRLEEIHDPIKTLTLFSLAFLKIDSEWSDKNILLANSIDFLESISLGK